MLLTKYAIVNGKEEEKVVQCDLEKLMKKITNRKFEFEGNMFALKGFTRYRGYKLSRSDKHTSGASNQDMNLDVNIKKKQVYTEIGSSEQFYQLTDAEYKEFSNELESRITE